MQNEIFESFRDAVPVPIVISANMNSNTANVGLSRDEYYGQHYAFDPEKQPPLTKTTNRRKYDALPTNSASNQLKRSDNNSNDSVTNWKKNPSRNVTIGIFYLCYVSVFSYLAVF
jgi:hypothetical protein